MPAPCALGSRAFPIAEVVSVCIGQVAVRRAANKLQSWYRGVKPYRRFRKWHNRRLAVKGAAYRDLRNWYVSIRHWRQRTVSTFFYAWKNELQETRQVGGGPHQKHLCGWIPTDHAASRPLSHPALHGHCDELSSPAYS
jgi:hypothetical protein